MPHNEPNPTDPTPTPTPQPPLIQWGQGRDEGQDALDGAIQFTTWSVILVGTVLILGAVAVALGWAGCGVWS